MKTRVEGWSFPSDAPGGVETIEPDDELTPRQRISQNRWVDIEDISPEDVLPIFRNRCVVKDAMDPLDLLPDNLRIVPRIHRTGRLPF